MTATSPHVFSDIAVRAFDALAEQAWTQPDHDLDHRIAKPFEALGASSFAYANFYTSTGKGDTFVVNGAFEPRWAARYIGEAYSSRDAMAGELLLSDRPYTWRDVAGRRRLSEDQKNIWEEARGHGLHDGLFLPIRETSGSYAAVVLSGEDIDFSDSLTRATALALSMYYAAATQLSGMRVEIDPAPVPPSLTARQTECLKWVRQGKSSSDIADILGISTSTVDEHIADACRRLGVRTRVQAVVEACLFRIISS